MSEPVAAERGGRYPPNPSALADWRSRLRPARLHRHVAGHLLGILAALAGVAVVSWLIDSQHLLAQVGDVAPLYLIVVVGSAATFGRTAAVVAALAAVSSYHLLFIRPYGEISFGRPSNILAFGVFLLVGLVIGELAAALRGQLAATRTREDETLALFRLSRAIAAARSADEIRRAIVGEARRTFGADYAGLNAAGDDGGRRTLAESGAAPADMITLAARRDQAEQETSGEDQLPAVRLLPLGSGGEIELPLGRFGSLRLILSRDNWSRLPEPTARLWRAYQDQIILGLDRAYLTEETRALEQQRQKEAFQSAVLATVSHDLRTPLAAIKAFAGNLREVGLRDKATHRLEMIEAIDRETDRLHRLVSNLLDFSRLQAGALIPRKDWYLLDELVREVVHRFSQRAPSARVVIESSASDKPVLVDDVLFDQILSNLLENAARLAPTGSSITVRQEADDANVWIAVEDEGPGIAAEDLPHIFDRFYQGQRGRGGSGLGLAICQGLVEALEGEICAENRAEGGARFRFRLPAPAGLLDERLDM